MKKIVLIETTHAGISYLLCREDATRLLGLDLEFHIIQSSFNNEISQEIQDKYVTSVHITDDFSQANLVTIINKIGNVDIILAGTEYAVEVATQVANHFNLKHMDFSVLPFVRNKHAFRKKMTSLGLSDIAYAIIEKNEDLSKYIDFTYPAVIKPTDMAGSIAVKKINNHAELVEFCHDIWNELPNDLVFKATGALELEEYIDGEEFSVEGIATEHDVFIHSISKKLFGAEPYFVETGFIINLAHDETFAKVVSDYAKAIVKGIGLTIGAFHLELRVKKDGTPVAIEIGARLAGCNMIQLIKMATGVDIALISLAQHLELPIDDLHHKHQNYVVGSAFVCFDENNTGYFQGIIDDQDIISHPKFLTREDFITVGEKISDRKDFTSYAYSYTFKSTDSGTILDLISKACNLTAK